MSPIEKVHSRLRWWDLLDETIAGIVQRPSRSALTALGSALGLAAFVAVLGLTSTAGGQISGRFTALAATEISLERIAEAETDPAAFPQDAQQRVQSLAGAQEIGVSWPIPVKKAEVSARPPELAGAPGEALPIRAATPGYLRAVHAKPVTGVLFNEFHDNRAEQVAVLGKAAAARLGITQLDAQPAIFVDGRAFTVVGIIGQVDRDPESLLSVFIPANTVTSDWGPSPKSGQATRMLIDTELGAAQQLGRQAKIAARPDSPELTKAIVPPNPHDLHDQINTDVNTLFLVLAAVSLLIGAVGIANTCFVAVMERVNEIGLRRALGARRRHIGGQFLMESAALGLLGGLVGTAVGIIAVLVVALVQQWTPVLQPELIYPAPLVGVATGLLAGLYPAWRASRIEPADALRR